MKLILNEHELESVHGGGAGVGFFRTLGHVANLIQEFVVGTKEELANLALNRARITPESRFAQEFLGPLAEVADEAVLEELFF